MNLDELREWTASILEGHEHDLREAQAVIKALRRLRAKDSVLLDVHAPRHQDGGDDEISVAGLSGVLANLQRANSLTAKSENVTIDADGQITIPSLDSCRLIVSANSGVADDLDGFAAANYAEGKVLVLYPASGHTITVRHNSGTANNKILTSDGNKVVLGGWYLNMVLQAIGGYWAEVVRPGHLQAHTLTSHTTRAHSELTDKEAAGVIDHADNCVSEPKLKVVDAPAAREVLAYSTTPGSMEWMDIGVTGGDDHQHDGVTGGGTIDHGKLANIGEDDHHAKLHDLDSHVTGRLRLPLGDNLTIADGVITVTHSFHNVDTENQEATDNLDTILGDTPGDFLILSTVNTARKVVVKHATGNILLQYSAHRILGTNWDSIVLFRWGTTYWMELGAQLASPSFAQITVAYLLLNGWMNANYGYITNLNNVQFAALDEHPDPVEGMIHYDAATSSFWGYCGGAWHYFVMAK